MLVSLVVFLHPASIWKLNRVRMDLEFHVQLMAVISSCAVVAAPALVMVFVLFMHGI